MDFIGNEIGPGDGTFWHSYMDLYYGYQLGEVVEVEHEPNKYWLATIEYSFKHLLLLKWVGNFEEFWVDTSNMNSTTSSSLANNEFNPMKRLFPPGYHLQSQLKSQFTLERPSKVLIVPSLYNPANDPYANIKTVDDLLTHEIDEEANKDAYQTNNTNSEPASLVMAKCKTKIAYGQEDVDELEAALQNLNDIDSDGNGTRTETSESSGVMTDDDVFSKSQSDLTSSSSKSEPITSSVQSLSTIKTTNESQLSEPALLPPPNESTTKEPINNEIPDEDPQILVELCKSIQESAINKGRYFGLDKNSHKVYYLKPKQFFEMGGANHERVFVPGTILEVCHTEKKDNVLELYHWFATVLKNVGGRLTLRWFLCDEPKFKQGRLELKANRSVYIKEEEDSDNLEEDKVGVDANTPDSQNGSEKREIPVKMVTFCMSFCDPRIHSISHAKTFNRIYKMPHVLRSILVELLNEQGTSSIEQAYINNVFDPRRMNLDKDRPIIDHILSTARWLRPQYVNLSFAEKDTNSRREILLSTPKTTKLFRGYVKRQLEIGVYEIHSEPMTESGDSIKFIYPYDSSYTVLPTSWADNNQDCLSIDASRNPTPTPAEGPRIIKEEVSNENINSNGNDNNLLDVAKSNQLSEPKQEPNDDPFKYTLLCEIPKMSFVEPKLDVDGGGENLELHENVKMDLLEPTYWSRLFRDRELEVAQFQCKLDNSSMETTLSKCKVMDQLEVVHPSSDVTICSGRIRKIVYPLLWIQISADSYTVLPFNSTNIYPSRWCEMNNHPLVSLLPPRKRVNQGPSQNDKKRSKRSKLVEVDRTDTDKEGEEGAYEKEQFDLTTLTDKQFDIDSILNEKSMYIQIFFNHKCFTGPSLSKGKICSLPQYVGPGPMRLVMEEVVTKVISVAYVPPRILNDLSSKAFEELLTARGMTNTSVMSFKAKYQKRVHREGVPVCLNPDDVKLYCECLCEHLKCCYNLFGPNLYDGDDCPGHCRALTKSNKFMKRATYYREKARLGEFINDNNGNKKSNTTTNSSNTTTNSNNNSKTSRARYAGRDSFESTSSSLSRSEQANSRASSAPDEVPLNELKENLVVVQEMEEVEMVKKEVQEQVNQDELNVSQDYVMASSDTKAISRSVEPEVDDSAPYILHSAEQEQNIGLAKIVGKEPQVNKWPTNDSEFAHIDTEKLQPEEWTVDDVANHLEWCRLGCFKPYMTVEGVDGQALLLLDKNAIKEHFQYQQKSDYSYSQEEVGKLCRFVEYVKKSVNRSVQT